MTDGRPCRIGGRSLETYFSVPLFFCLNLLLREQTLARNQPGPILFESVSAGRSPVNRAASAEFRSRQAQPDLLVRLAENVRLGGRGWTFWEAPVNGKCA